MGLISTDDREYLAERFGQELQNEVHVELFTQGAFVPMDEDASLPDDGDENDVAEACQITGQIFEELAAISPKIVLERYDVNTAEGRLAAEKAEMNLEMLPAFRFKSAGLAGQSSYFGVPTGFEFGALIETISDFSRGVTELGVSTQQKVKAINVPLNILVFVTPT